MSISLTCMTVSPPRGFHHNSKQFVDIKWPLEKSKGAIKKGQSRETGNMVHKTQDEDKQSKNTSQYVEHHYTKQTQITEMRHNTSYKSLEAESTENPFYAEIVTDLTTRNSKRKDIIGKHKNQKDLKKPNNYACTFLNAQLIIIIKKKPSTIQTTMKKNTHGLTVSRMIQTFEIILQRLF